MAKVHDTDGPLKSTTGSKRPASNGSWKGFVNRTLTAKEQEDLKGMDEGGEFTLEALFDMVSQGYKISIREDRQTKSFLAAATDDGAGSGSRGYTLTARGGTPQKAFASLMYKHYVIFQGLWKIDAPTSEEYG